MKKRSVSALISAILLLMGTAFSIQAQDFADDSSGKGLEEGNETLNSCFKNPDSEFESESMQRFEAASNRATIDRRGTIGSAEWTIDSQGVLKIGEGEFVNNDPDYQWPWSDCLHFVTRVDGTANFRLEGSAKRMFKNDDRYFNRHAIQSMDLSGWDTSAVTDMSYMFQCCYDLTSLNVSGWDTSAVTDMNNMFHGCCDLTTLDVSGWNTSNVTNMSHMFWGCDLTSLDVSGWDTGNVTNMFGMFEKCERLTSLDVSGWNTANVIDMSCMFHRCSSLTALDVSGWNTSNATEMYRIFGSCSSLTSLNVSDWDTSNVTEMLDMFYGCDDLTSLDVSDWDTSEATTMDSMFSYCRSLTSLDVSRWDMSRVSNTRYMFYECNSLTSIDVSKWSTANIAVMPRMFGKCSSLVSLDIADWVIPSAAKVAEIFSGCSSLDRINYSQKTSRLIKELPEQSRWYQNGNGPYPISLIPAVPAGKTALLARTEDKIEISRVSISGINAKYIYTGKAITPRPVLKFGNEEFFQGRDFKLTYSNNVNPGKATITITGIGNYTGSITRTFEIVKTDQSSVRSVSMHRLYNPNSGEHFYTKNTKEKDHLVSLGWKYEGEGWKAPETSKVPVYRLYNKNAGDHHYTFDKNERDYLVKLGWTDEGIGWYSDEAKGVPLYRQYNSNAKAGSHNYTTSKNENDVLVSLGWKAEGIAWYGMK